MLVRNPRNGQYDYILEVDDAEEVSQKGTELRRSQKEWLSKGIDHRIEILLQFAAKLEEKKDEIFDQLSIDTGRRKISHIEIEGAIGVIKGRCFSVKHLLGNQEMRTSVTNPTVQIKQERVPYDLVGVISPWNFPLLLALIDTIPALLAGCSVLLKPSEVTPRFMGPLEECINEVPELSKVLSIIRGGAEAGKAVVDSSDAICFTGSVATGKKIGARCAERFIPAFLELGGKDPAIILADADIDVTTDAVIRSCAGATGQACQSLERLYVHKDIYDVFLNTLTDKVDILTFNSDYKKGGTLGPLIFEKQAQTIVAQLEDATVKGATIHTGGEIENINGGLWLKPTIVTNVNHSMDLMTEETFGPVLPVMAFEDTDEAIMLANDSIYGLSASVFGANEEVACQVASQIDAGGISINDASLTNQVFDAEKNSFKESGLNGSRMGADGFLRFFRKKALLIQRGQASDIHTQDEEV